MKIAVIGAGSTYTPELIEGVINRAESFPVTKISLMDIDERKLSIVGALAKRMVGHAKMNCAVNLTMDYDEALGGADFVFAQIRVGRLPARVLDEKIPLKHFLIGQETTGVGGFFKALRTIPVLMDVAGRMERLCPNAFMINFSNPSGICAQALLNNTNIKMMGLCNAPIGMIKGFNDALGTRDADFDYVGLNHLSFITSVRQDGRDFVKEALEGDEALMDKLEWQNGFGRQAIKLMESLPNGYVHYFHQPRKSVYGLLSKDSTRGEDCIEIEEELLSMFSDEKLCVKPDELSKRGGAMYSEAAVSLAESIYLNDKKIHVVNTLNGGALSFLRDDDAVEIRARVGKNGAETIPPDVTGNDYVKSLILSVKTYERYTAEAALTGCRETALKALISNPLINDADAAEACFDEMLEAHKEYLPAFFKRGGCAR